MTAREKLKVALERAKRHAFRQIEEGLGKLEALAKEATVKVGDTERTLDAEAAALAEDARVAAQDLAHLAQLGLTKMTREAK